MKRVMVYKSISDENPKEYVMIEDFIGLLHGFSTYGNEYSTFPVAIVEHPNGYLKSINIESIRILKDKNTYIDIDKLVGPEP